MKKKFSAKEILTRDQMKKVAGSGYCTQTSCGINGGCQFVMAVGCKCVKDGVNTGIPCV